MPKEFVDFEKLREDPVAIAQMMNLELRPSGKNFRAKCPFCESKDGMFLNNTDGEKKGLYYLHCCQKGGDIAGLYAKLNSLEPYQAALEIKKRLGAPSDPRPDVRIDKDKLKPLDYLLPEHDDCKATGITLETAKKLGIGYAPKGTFVGYVCIPVSHNGVLQGYVGYKKGEPMKRAKSISQGALFNADTVTSDEPLHVAHDPLSAVLAIQGGVPNVIAFLGESDLHSLASLVILMKDRGIASYETL